MSKVNLVGLFREIIKKRSKYKININVFGNVLFSEIVIYQEIVSTIVKICDITKININYSFNDLAHNISYIRLVF